MEKQTPEEQLLKLIEGQDDKNKPAGATAPSAGGEAQETAAAPALSTYLGRFFRRLKPVSISLKTINRLLATFAVLSCGYLTWDLVAGEPSYNELKKEIARTRLALPGAERELPNKDLLDYLLTFKARNIFEPVPKAETVKIELVNPNTNTTTTNITPPIIPVVNDPFIQQLKTVYKLVGITRYTEKVAGTEKPVAKATIEDNKEQIFVIGVDDEPIKGSAMVSEGEVNYRLKVKEIKEDTVILIEETSQKPMELVLTR